MAVVIRMARFGTKGKPFFRVVVADSRFPKEGRSIETIGTYDPSSTPPAVKLNSERLTYWHKNGAQLTNIVADLAEQAGLLTVVTAKKIGGSAKPKASKAAASKSTATTAPEKKVAKKAAPKTAQKKSGKGKSAEAKA